MFFSFLPSVYLFLTISILLTAQFSAEPMQIVKDIGIHTVAVATYLMEAARNNDVVCLLRV